ncbi:MAG: ribonuclease P protein component [Candidatus Eremiobacteraeota bacterium]|nr:ribonuclease P protein component [Candidatus Eremiobacteraeota bacterium]MBV8355826.1 ribonuclease P protein component [Candidatus Eremiobacteraeota bacterium]
MRPYESLRREADFVRVRRRGRRIEGKHFRLWALAVAEAEGGERRSRVGIVSAKDVGSAVERNRARRRLRALLFKGGDAAVPAGYDVVLWARPSARTAPFAEMRADLASALGRLG